MLTERCSTHCMSGLVWSVHCGGCHDPDRTRPCRGIDMTADEYERLLRSLRRPTLREHLRTWWLERVVWPRVLVWKRYREDVRARRRR